MIVFNESLVWITPNVKCESNFLEYLFHPRIRGGVNDALFYWQHPYLIVFKSSSARGLISNLTKFRCT